MNAIEYFVQKEQFENNPTVYRGENEVYKYPISPVRDE